MELLPPVTTHAQLMFSVHAKLDLLKLGPKVCNFHIREFEGYN